MTRKRVIAALGGLAVAIAVIAIAGSGGAASGADITHVAMIGHLTVGPASSVNLAHAPTGFKASAPPIPAMVRGAPLPAGPSTGSKPGAKISAAPNPLSSQTNAFNGIDLSTSDCGCQPPDVNATVGDGYIVEVVNLEFAVYNTSGTLQFRESLNNFIGSGDGLSDPRVVWDPTWGRWAISFLDENTPSLWLLYSQSSNPLGGWWFYNLGVGLSAGSIMDYPNVGMDQNVFVYTTNNFDSGGTYINSTALAVPKSRVYNGFGFSYPYYDVNYNTTPAIMGGHPTQITNDLYMLSPDDANNLMYVYYWHNTGASPHLTYKGSIPYTWVAPPRRVNQPGTSQTLDPLDGRIVWAPTQLDNRVWFAHGVGLAGYPSVNYGFVAPGNMSIHYNTAFHTASSDDFNPSISVEKNPDGHPEAWVTWAYTDTPNNVPTRDVFARQTGVALGHLTGAQFSPNGSSTGESRFGDYSSSWPEYNAVGGCAEGWNALVANQYFEANGDWATRIARVHDPSCTP
jgi:hypothetical protein